MFPADKHTKPHLVWIKFRPRLGREEECASLVTRGLTRSVALSLERVPDVAPLLGISETSGAHAVIARSGSTSGAGAVLFHVVPRTELLVRRPRT